MDRRTGHRRGRRVAATHQPGREAPFGTEGPRRPARRRHREFCAGERGRPLVVCLEGLRRLNGWGMDSDTFRSVLGRFASGVTILTARDASGADHGMTVSAFCSLSLEPPLVLFCIDHAASMHGLLVSDP